MKDKKKILIIAVLLLLLIITVIFISTIKDERINKTGESPIPITSVKDDNIIQDEPVPVDNSPLKYFLNGENYRHNDFSKLLIDEKLCLGEYSQKEFKLLLTDLYGSMENYDFITEAGIITYNMPGYTFTVFVINSTNDIYVVDSITITDKTVESNFYTFIGESIQFTELEMNKQTRISSFRNIHDNSINQGWFQDSNEQNLIIFDNNLDDYSYHIDKAGGNEILAVTIAMRTAFD